MSALLEKIRSRGYWKVVIRPSTFVQKRVHEKSTLRHILEARAVEIKGRNFPHVDAFRGSDIEGPDWIGQEIKLGPTLELWRFYQSGQFVLYSAIEGDWKDISGQGVADLSVESAVTRFTEIFELAERLTFTEVGDAGTHLEILVGNLRKRKLSVPNAYGREELHKACSFEFTHKLDVSSVELVTGKEDMALKATNEFFKCFRWNPSLELLRDIQAGILSGKQVQLLGHFISR